MITLKIDGTIKIRVKFWWDRINDDSSPILTFYLWSLYIIFSINQININFSLNQQTILLNKCENISQRSKTDAFALNFKLTNITLMKYCNFNRNTRAAKLSMPWFYKIPLW